MKLSVSLPDEDVSFLDSYAASNQVPSRSAALRVAVDVLRSTQLESAYAAAFEEWTESDEAGLWDAVAGDATA